MESPLAVRHYCIGGSLKINNLHWIEGIKTDLRRSQNTKGWLLVKLASIFAEARLHNVLGRARVLIADRNYFARQALRQVFEREKDFAICGEAVHGRDAVTAALLLRPDLVVLDLVMPVMNGVGAARTLKRLMPALPMIVRYGLKDKCVTQATKLVEIGALVSKTEPLGSLVHRARRLLAGTEVASASASI